MEIVIVLVIAAAILGYTYYRARKEERENKPSIGGSRVLPKRGDKFPPETPIE